YAACFLRSSAPVAAFQSTVAGLRGPGSSNCSQLTCRAMRMPGLCSKANLANASMAVSGALRAIPTIPRTSTLPARTACLRLFGLFGFARPLPVVRAPADGPRAGLGMLLDPRQRGNVLQGRSISAGDVEQAMPGAIDALPLVNRRRLPRPRIVRGERTPQTQ